MWRRHITLVLSIYKLVFPPPFFLYTMVETRGRTAHRNTPAHSRSRSSRHRSLTVGHSSGHHVSVSQHDHSDIDNVTDTIKTISSVNKKKKGMSKAKKREVKFAKKVQTALTKPMPSNIWTESTSTLAGSLDITLTNGTANSDTINQFYTSSHAGLVLNPGQLWKTGGGTNFSMYPYAPLALVASDATLQLHAETGMSKLRTIVCRAKIRLYNNQVTQNPATYTVYTFVAACDISDAAYCDPITAINTLETAVHALTSTGYTNRSWIGYTGVSPLDIPGLGKYWKQETRETIFLNPSAEATFDWPRPRRPNFAFAECDGKYAIKHKTQAMFVVCNTGNTTNPIPASNIVGSLTVAKTYHYKWFAGEEPNSAMYPMSTRLVL